MYWTQYSRKLACRIQIPLILAFALTVNRAQGQTLRFVEIATYSFFAPGQMGVAVGRATSTDGLRIVNLNRKAAYTKNPDVVYEFYDRHFSDFLDMLCCSKHSLHLSTDTNASEDTDDGPNSSSTLTIVTDLGTSYHDEEFPQLESPWEIGKFITEHEHLPFMANFTETFFQSDSFRKHYNFCISKSMDFLMKHPSVHSNGHKCTPS